MAEKVEIVTQTEEIVETKQTDNKKVEIVMQQDKIVEAKQADNKDVCVTCQNHTPKGHGEWWVCMLRK